jgi:hypothetical protein
MRAPRGLPTCVSKAPKPEQPSTLIFLCSSVHVNNIHEKTTSALQCRMLLACLYHHDPDVEPPQKNQSCSPRPVHRGLEPGIPAPGSRRNQHTDDTSRTMHPAQHPFLIAEQTAHPSPQSCGTPAFLAVRSTPSSCPGAAPSLPPNSSTNPPPPRSLVSVPTPPTARCSLPPRSLLPLAPWRSPARRRRRRNVDGCILAPLLLRLKSCSISGV